MGSDSVDRYRAVGRTDALEFDPTALVIEEDDSEHPHYALHEDRRTINPQIVRAMKSGAPIPPIQVTVVGKGPERYTRVDDGRCRVRHLRVVNEQLREEGKSERTIQAMIVRGDPNRVRVIANSNRRRDNPLLRAREFADAVSMGRSEAEVRDDMGASKPTVKRWKVLLTLTPEVQKAVGAGKVPLVFVDTIDGKPVAKQLAALERVVNANAKGERAKAIGKAAANGESGPVRVWRMRPKPFLHTLSERLNARESAIVRFALGDDEAVKANPDLSAILEDLGWKPKRVEAEQGAA